MKTRYPDAARLFTLDTSTHEMTVLHDDGVYRHLRFRRPDTRMYWFDLVTWPGCLTIHADMGTYTFARVRDMTEFFDGHDINPGYWGEKVQGNGDPRSKGVTDYSPERARSYITEAFDAWAEEQGGLPLATVRDCWDEIARQLLDDGEVEDERAFRDAVEDFYWGGMDDGFRFRDTWDWDLADFRHAFLWCCFAVHRGVNQYRVLKDLAKPLPPLEFPDPQPQPAQTAQVTRSTIVTAKTKEGIL